MVNSNTIDIVGVGQVQFERSKKAKHLNISVKPFAGVRVAVPDGLSFQKAEEFVNTKKDWISSGFSYLCIMLLQFEHNTQKSFFGSSSTTFPFSSDIGLRWCASINLTPIFPYLLSKSKPHAWHI